MAKDIQELLEQNEQILFELKQRILIFFTEEIYITDKSVIRKIGDGYTKIDFSDITKVEKYRNNLYIFYQDKNEIFSIKQELQEDFLKIIYTHSNSPFEDTTMYLKREKKPKFSFIKQRTKKDSDDEINLYIEKLNHEVLVERLEKQNNHVAKSGEVALNSPTIQEELPFSFVHYPNHYGTFISFSETKNSERFFCNCEKTPIENCLKLHDSIDEQGILINNTGLRMHFDNTVILQAEKKLHKDGVFKYKPKLCHRCNMKTPSLFWCVDMYGTKFKQQYGWYVQQNQYKNAYYRGIYLKDKCPEIIASKLSQIPEHIDHEASTFTGLGHINAQYSQEELKGYIKIAKEVYKMIENETREEFGIRKIGGGWISETIMSQLISQIFPDEEIIRHYRPECLGGLELDVFLPGKNLAFEYQGQQHFFAIKAWGGEKSLKRVQERDKKKKELCKELGIRLVEILYTDPLTKDFIQNKIDIK